MPKIEISTFIIADRQRVFDLARSLDLHMISTSKTNEKAIAGRLDGLIELGETVTWRAKHLGVYQRLKVKITRFERPAYFQDEMISGAFKSFVHEHYFIGNDNGETQMKDVFTYHSPFGIIGRLVDFLFLKKYMTNLLINRNEVIKEYAESDQWKSVISMSQ
ncbi:MAG: ligand-binding SRPBCC domain-containing protein [Roseivirga sp.]|jgi:ligand-binding SRPBCC domain-containing protein